MIVRALLDIPEQTAKRRHVPRNRALMAERATLTDPVTHVIVLLDIREQTVKRHLVRQSHAKTAEHVRLMGQVIHALARPAFPERTVKLPHVARRLA